MKRKGDSIVKKYDDGLNWEKNGVLGRKGQYFVTRKLAVVSTPCYKSAGPVHGDMI